jgi:hypothetical protein
LKGKGETGQTQEKKQEFFHVGPGVEVSIKNREFFRIAAGKIFNRPLADLVNFM